MLTVDEKEIALSLADNCTAGDIARQIKASTKDVYSFIKSKGIEPLTDADILRYRLYKESPYKTREQMFADLAVSTPTFEKYVRETSVKFMIPETNKPRMSFWDRLRELERQEGISDYIKGVKSRD